MYLINKKDNRISKLEEKTFSELGFREREHLQEWLANNPESLGEELLIIQKEFDGFNDTNERLDLLALDKQGNLVIIENKLDDSGRDVTWQALKYASYCSSLSKENIKQIYQTYLTVQGINDTAENKLSEFFEGQDYDEIAINPGTQQRIIMVARKFRKEVTSTVLWLMNYKIRVQCFKIIPFILGEQIFINIEQILPIKEVEDFQISMADKAQDDISSQENMKERHSLRLKFWSQLINFSSNKTDLFHGLRGSKDNWIGIGIGISGINLNLVVTKKYARTELYINRGDQAENKMVFDFLSDYKEQIESKFCSALIWERMDDMVTCRIKNQNDNYNLFDSDNWLNMNEFLIDSTIRMEQAFKEPINKLITHFKKK